MRRPLAPAFPARSLLVLLALALGGCGADDPAASTSTTPGTSTTTVGAGGASTTGAGGASSGGAGHGGAASGGAGQGGATSATWRSALYPESWTPATTDADGRYLPDFSYAGWHGDGADPAPAAGLPTFEVTGADATGAADATAAIAAAIASAESAGGGVVHVPAGLYRVDGLLAVKASRVVLRGDGPDKSRVFFTKVDASMKFASHLRLGGSPTTDLEVALAADGASRDDAVLVADPGGLAVGDDVDVGFVITPAFVDEHGMTGVWQAFNGTWQPFFRRHVVAIDAATKPAKVTLDVPLRYAAKTRDAASLRRVKGLVSEVGVESIGLANAGAWDAAWALTQTHVIELSGVKDAWVKDVATFSPPTAPASGPGAGTHLLSGGVLVSGSKRVTLQGSRFGFAEHRGDGGNGYLVELRQANEVLIRDTVAEAGRHNFIQNWGFGTTGCVLLRVTSKGGVTMLNQSDTLNLTGYSETHHSLATANLVDASTFDDGWSTVNRGLESTGAGHTGTENVMWNLRGKGMVRSLQYGTGYVIGTKGLYTVLESPLPMGQGTEPVDWSEGLEAADGLEPASLYEDQRKRRLGP